MNNNLRKLFLPILVTLLLTGCVTAYLDDYAAEPKTDITPLMWLVTSPGGQTMYLFGSIHAAAEDLYPLPAFIMDAFHRSDYLAVEVDLLSLGELSIEEQMALLALQMYTDGRTIADDIGPELHEKARALLAESELEFPLELYDRFKPIMWYSFLLHIVLERSDITGEFGVDLHFLHLAAERRMEVLEVESAMEQMEILTGLSIPLQAAMMEDMLEDLDRAVYELNEMYRLWKQGNAEEMYAFSISQFNRLGPELAAEFYDAILTQRDILMTETARGYMAEGKKVFFVVGLLHLLGEGSVVDLLIQAGYDVALVR